MRGNDENVRSKAKMNSVELIIQIESAFSSVALGNGVGLYEAEALDNYADAEKVSSAKVKDRESWKSWIDIPEKVIEQFSSALCFVDSEGMRFLLPAYMLFACKYYKTSDSFSIDSVIYALDRGIYKFGNDISILTTDQISAIIAFLKFMILDAGEEFVDAEAALRAYENHWSVFEPKI
jgi:hypothetical protein